MTLPSINRSPGPRDKLKLVRMRLKCKTKFGNIHKLWSNKIKSTENVIRLYPD
jgi:hypothetical protein